jgi:hypothetical protein
MVKPIAPQESAEPGQPNAPLLSDDATNLIMTLCLTFETLQSLILVSTAFHRVFESHRKV